MKVISSVAADLRRADAAAEIFAAFDYREECDSDSGDAADAPSPTPMRCCAGRFDYFMSSDAIHEIMPCFISSIYRDDDILLSQRAVI